MLTAFFGEGANIEQPVFCMESDGDIFWDIVSDQRRHPNSQVGVHAIFKFLADPLGLPFTCLGEPFNDHFTGEGALLDRLFEMV